MRVVCEQWEVCGSMIRVLSPNRDLIGKVVGSSRTGADTSRY